MSGVRLPISWIDLGFPPAWVSRGVVLHSGEPAWSWRGPVPDLGIRLADPPPAEAVAGWEVDHLVVGVGSLASALEACAAVGHRPRRTAVIRGRATAFLVAGTLLELIEVPGVRRPRLFGVAIATDDLEQAIAGMRHRGAAVTDSRPAVQAGRRIATVRGLGAGLALMSARRQGTAAQPPDVSPGRT